MSTETNHISAPKIETEQEVKPQKPMSIEAYISALRKEAEVAKLRATISESIFKENLARVQLQQLAAGQIAAQQNREAPTEETPDNPSETTEIE